MRSLPRIARAPRRQALLLCFLAAAEPAFSAGPALEEHFVDTQHNIDFGSDVSGDGLVLSGSTVTGAYTMPVLWDLQNPLSAGVVLRGPRGTTICSLYRLSYDGQVGAGGCVLPGGSSAAYRIFSTGRYEELPTLYEGTAEAHDLSADGSTVVGFNADRGGINHSLYWRGLVAFEIAGLGGQSGSAANAVSGDGQVVAGTVYDSGGNTGYRWTWNGRTEGEGIIDRIETLPGYGGVEVTDLSRDGRVVVGNLTGARRGAFRWTQGGGTVELGLLETDGSAVAAATNATGAVMVGTATRDNGLHAFRWSLKTGMITVEEWLRRAGLTIADGLTMIGNAVSEDGSVVAGLMANGHLFVARATPDPDDLAVDPGPDPRILARRSPVTATPPADGGHPLFIDVTDYAASLPDFAAALSPEARPDRDPLQLMPAPGHCASDQRGARSLDDPGPGDLSVMLACGHPTGAVVRFGLGLGERDHRGPLTTLVARQAVATLEMSTAPAEGLVLTGGLDLSAAEARHRRSYHNGSTPMQSEGITRGGGVAARLRLDAPGALALGPVLLTPHVEAGLASLALGNAQETGGDVPASFDWRAGLSGRIAAGIGARLPLSAGVTLVGQGTATLTRGSPAKGTVWSRALPLQFAEGADRGWTTRLTADFGAEIESGPGTLYAGASLSRKDGETGIGLFAGMRVAF